MNVLVDSPRPVSGPSALAMPPTRLLKDGARASDDSDSSVSPISSPTPACPGTRWTRFFPELSSHFSLVSPISVKNQNTMPHPPLVRRMPTIMNHMRQSSSDSTEIKTGPSSLSSDEAVDDGASSCYSRRSSVTSLNSEVSASGYRSADAFSIISPTKAGVFDDSASVFRTPASLARGPSAAEAKHKPLPREPPIQLAPLSVRSRHRPASTIHEDTFEIPVNATVQTQTCHHPTLLQAAEELENALADLAEYKEQPNSSQTSLPCLDSPLQVSRGKMDMIATRAAPRPPVDSQPKIPMIKALSDEDIKRAKNPQKGKVSFSFPGFGKKQGRNHLRSLSGSSLTTWEAEHPLSPVQGLSLPRKPELEKDAAVPTLSLTRHPIQRRASVSSERELRLQLPRLQTKDMESSNSHKPLPPLAKKETSDTLRPLAGSKRKPRRSYSDPEEKIFVTSSKAGIVVPQTTQFAMDIACGPEMVFELEADLPLQKAKSPIRPFVFKGQMPDSLPDSVVRAILGHCCSLGDLFNFAVMNKQFYRVFKKDELDIMKGTMFTMSAPAWELREMSPPWDSEWQALVDPDAPVPEYTPTLYIQRFTQDIYTLVRLKSLILARCGTFLRTETIRGLAGMDDARATEIDDAFWRVWTFCRIFGSGKGREGDVLGQMDWFNGGVMAMNHHTSATMSMTEPFGMNNVLFEPPEGFGRGNKGGLSQNQLYDMTEIWTCLGVLLQPMHGKCSEARRAGVFDGHDVIEGDTAKEEAKLEEWTYYVLSLGPSAVLALGSIASINSTTEIFQKAQTMGLTRWEEADSSRSFFFREAVSKAYKPREETAIRKSHRLPGSGSSARSSRSSGSRNSSPTRSNSSGSRAPLQLHRRRQAAYAAQLRNRRNQPQNSWDASYSEERPLSSFEVIMDRLSGSASQQHPPLPTTIITPPPASTTPPPPPPPPQQTQPIQDQYHLPPQPRIPQTVCLAAAPPPPYQPQVRDPVDQAIDMMVHELGFQEEDAKWALKITDTGEGINPNAAVALLMREYQNCEQRNSRFTLRSKRSSVLDSVIKSQESRNSGWRWA